MEPLCLVVDDDAALRTYLSIILQHKGIQSLEAENAGEALQILHKRGAEIDLLITDIQMPGKYGYRTVGIRGQKSVPLRPCDSDFRRC